jgi:hypothetical protein
MRMRRGPALRVDLREASGIRERLDRCYQGRLDLSGGKDRAAEVRLVSADRLPPSAAGEHLVVVEAMELSAIVRLMGERPDINHVVAPDCVDQPVTAAVLWKLATGTVGRPAHLLGRGFSGRRVALRDSDKRAPRIEAIAEYAAECGAASRATRLVSDVAEELITNALYDAPAERDGLHADRTTHVRLDREEACVVVYGADKEKFYVRVRDPFGSLRRERVFEVLARCMDQRGVPFDTTRGGAGLGMMRIFDASAVIVVHVRAHTCTELLVGIDLKRRRSTRDRAVHLFFEGQEGLP